jgi:uncharacterized protein YndB with AHSA1/START domain
VTNDATKLEIESERVLVITRTFAAPRRIVFDAITKPENVRLWRAAYERLAALVASLT